MALAPSIAGRPRRMKHWTPAEDRALLSWWGVLTIDTIGRKLGRTPKGCVDRSKALGLGAPSRGTWTMAALVKHLGYCDRAIKTAARRAGINLDWRRAHTTTLRSDGTHGPGATKFSLDDDDVELITAELEAIPSGRVMASRTGEWGTGRKPGSCLDCGTTDRPHYARGMCQRCYQRALAHRTHELRPIVRKKTKI